MNIKKIPVDHVDEGERLRTLNPVYVADIALSYELKGGEANGQITPIEVREPGPDGRYLLISGYHRLAAAKASHWKMISASIVKCTNDEAVLREIDENLVRHDLTALDRAVFMAKREDVWKLLNPDSVQGRAGAKARWHATRNIRFASDAAEKLGVSEDTIENWVNLAKATNWLTGETRKRVAASNIANNQSELKALSEITDETKRSQVIELLLSGEDGAPKKVAKALKELAGGSEEQDPDPVDKNYNDFMAIWTRSNKATKASITAFVVAQQKRSKRAAPANEADL